MKGGSYFCLLYFQLGPLLSLIKDIYEDISAGEGWAETEQGNGGEMKEGEMGGRGGGGDRADCG